MRLTRILAVASIVFVAGPVAAQKVGSSHLFPVVVHAQGLGDPPTMWQSDVTLHNVGEQSLTVALQLFPEGQANELDPSFSGQRSLQVSLAGHGTKTVEDVIGELGYTNGIKGVLLVTCDPDLVPGNPEGSAIVTTSRTYNTGSSLGTYGQTVPANENAINAYGTPSYATGARQDSRFRSNLGIVNLSQGGPVTVHYRVRDVSGAARAEGTKDIPPGSMGQWAFADLGVPNVTGPLTVELWLDAADVTPNPCGSSGGSDANSFMGYVSKVDGNPQGTGDAEFILAVPSQSLSCV